MEGIKPVLIDLSDYEAVGEGANGISLNHRTDPHILLKLYNEGKFRQSYDEWVLSKRVYETGILPFLDYAVNLVAVEDVHGLALRQDACVLVEH